MRLFAAWPGAIILTATPRRGATVQFQDINEAHQVLSDPARRGEYDAKWHPKAGDQSRRATAPARYHRSHRRFRRHRHLRTVLLGLGAMLFVSSAWAVIFTAMTAAHSGGYSYAYDSSAPSVAGGAPSCGFSMEMFPVTYVDDRGRATTSWGTEVRNCYGGSTRIYCRAAKPRRSRGKICERSRSSLVGGPPDHFFHRVAV